MHGSFYCSVSKSFFDTLLQVFLHFSSREKLMIENKRHPSWVSFVTIFLPAAQHFRVDRQLLAQGTMRCMVPCVYHIFPTRRCFCPALPSLK